jgi:WD40 repeat protein
MKKNRVLLIALFFGTMIAGAACNLARKTVQTPAGVQSATPFPIPTASLTATFPVSTPLPAPTTTNPPTRLPLTTSPIAPTLTRAAFLPANLLPISPQNASKLKPLAVLSKQGASEVAYSPDSHRVAAGFFVTNQVKIWDLTSGQELFTLSGHVDPRIISYLAFSPDGSRLASGAQGWEAPNDSLILWDALTGRELQRFSGVLGAISPDWRLAALSRREQSQGVTLILSDLASGEQLHSLKAPGDIYGVSFSPQGQQVAAKMYSVYQDLFSFWSVDNGHLNRTLYDWAGFSFSPDGRFIAALLDTGSGSDKGELNIFDAVTFKWIKTVAKDSDSLWYAYPVFSTDGNLLAASFGDHVILWDTQAWKELVSLPASGPSRLAFSPDGRLFTTSSQSGMLLLWGVQGGQ